MPGVDHKGVRFANVSPAKQGGRTGLCIPVLSDGVLSLRSNPPTVHKHK